MIRLLLALLIASIPASAFGQLAAAVSFADSAPEAGSVTYLIKQDLDTTGYDNGETWTTEAGTPNPNSTSFVWNGINSLSLPSGGGGARVRSPSFAAQSDIWVYCTVYFDSISTSANRTVIQLDDSSTSSVAFLISTGTTGQLGVAHGSATSGTVYTVSDDTRYHFWFRYVISSGSNDGILQFYASETDTIPGTPTATISSGTSTADCESLTLGNNTTGGYNFFFDKIRAAATAIGSEPE